MKKLFIATLLSITVFASSFAGTGTRGINHPAIITFKIEFKDASDATWTQNSDYTKVDFLMNDIRMEAFFDADGNTIATSSAITLEELPLSAKRTFAKKYEGYRVKEAIRFTSDTEQSYYIKAETDAETVIIKVDQSNSLSIYEAKSK